MAGKKNKEAKNRETKEAARDGAKENRRMFASIMRKLRDARFEISLFFFAIGIVMTIIAFFSPAGDKTPSFLYGVVSAVGNWYLWFWVIGPLIVIGSSWYAYDYIKKRRLFEDLMNTTARLSFLKTCQNWKMWSGISKKKTGFGSPRRKRNSLDEMQKVPHEKKGWGMGFRKVLVPPHPFPQHHHFICRFSKKGEERDERTEHIPRIPVFACDL